MESAARTSWKMVWGRNVKPSAVLIFGIPGAGKSTQAQRLARNGSFTHIETSELIWMALQNRTKTEITLSDGARIDLDEQERRMRAGELPDSAWVFSLMREAVVEAATLKRSVVFSGPPPCVAEAKYLIPVLESCYGAHVICVLLEIPREEAERRVYARGRTLDEHFLRRMQIFEEETKPVLEWLQKQGFLVYHLDGTKDEEKIAAMIEKIVSTKTSTESTDWRER